MTENELKTIDHSPIKTNQGAIIVLLLLSFILDTPWLVAVVAVVMLLGSLLGRPGFGFLYHLLLKPLGWLRPDVFADHPEPHRFAQAVGGVFASASALLLFVGIKLPGWVCTWVVIILAAFNLLLGFCAGCAMYYWFNRLHIPGFRKSALPDSIPDARPRQKGS
jgi:hypothetical protein